MERCQVAVAQMSQHFQLAQSALTAAQKAFNEATMHSINRDCDLYKTMKTEIGTAFSTLNVAADQFQGSLLDPNIQRMISVGESSLQTDSAD